MLYKLLLPVVLLCCCTRATAQKNEWSKVSDAELEYTIENYNGDMAGERLANLGLAGLARTKNYRSICYRVDKILYLLYFNNLLPAAEKYKKTIAAYAQDKSWITYTDAVFRCKKNNDTLTAAERFLEYSLVAKFYNGRNSITLSSEYPGLKKMYADSVVKYATMALALGKDQYVQDILRIEKEELEKLDAKNKKDLAKAQEDELMNSDPEGFLKVHDTALYNAIKKAEKGDALSFKRIVKAFRWQADDDLSMNDARCHYTYNMRFTGEAGKTYAYVLGCDATIKQFGNNQYEKSFFGKVAGYCTINNTSLQLQPYGRKEGVNSVEDISKNDAGIISDLKIMSNGYDAVPLEEAINNKMAPLRFAGNVTARFTLSYNIKNYVLEVHDSFGSTIKFTGIYQGL